MHTTNTKLKLAKSVQLLGHLEVCHKARVLHQQFPESLSHTVSYPVHSTLKVPQLEHRLPP